MSPGLQVLMDTLNGLGVTVACDGKRVICRPVRILTDELNAQLRVYRQEILDTAARATPPDPSGKPQEELALCSDADLIAELFGRHNPGAAVFAGQKIGYVAAQGHLLVARWRGQPEMIIDLCQSVIDELLGRAGGPAEDEV